MGPLLPKFLQNAAWRDHSTLVTYDGQFYLYRSPEERELGIGKIKEARKASKLCQTIVFDVH